MAKLARESKLRERRLHKQARKAARKDGSLEQPYGELMDQPYQELPPEGALINGAFGILSGEPAEPGDATPDPE